jgi:hypothetical protein
MAGTRRLKGVKERGNWIQRNRGRIRRHPYLSSWVWNLALSQRLSRFHLEHADSSRCQFLNIPNSPQSHITIIYFNCSGDPQFGNSVTINTVQQMGMGRKIKGVRVHVQVGARFLSSPCHPDRLWGPSRPAVGPIQPPIRWVPQFLYPRAKRWGCEADHSRPTT